ncbi:hypothetical protein M1O54_00110 [Dehalococcoidia bacterium]|nr:hypothetical protein [Dehalococcoidia bacterium]
MGGDEKTIWSCSGSQVFEINAAVLLEPIVTTNPATEIRRTSARAHGEITDVGAEMANERGFEWGTTPGLYPNSVTETGTFGVGPYSLTLTGLPSIVTIYYRAKARNPVDWGYGDELTFFTVDPPAVTTRSIADLTPTSATGRGFITDTGGINCDERGFDWGISPGVYINTVTEAGSFEAGAYSLSLIGLPVDTIIYYRARAHNPSGWSYGNEVSFTTGLVEVPTVETLEVTDITHVSAVASGKILSTGGEDCEEYGFEWGVSPNLTDSMTGIGAWKELTFSEVLRDLLPGTTYVFRAKARNSAGWGFGPLLSFTTIGRPAVLTRAVTGITPTSARIHAFIADTGGPGWRVLERGFEWGFSPGVYIDSLTEEGTFGAGRYSLSLTGLPSFVTVYVRAKVRNVVGWAYGGTIQFITVHVPVLSTLPPTQVGPTSAIARGRIIDIGYDSPTERGFDWGTEPGALINSVTETGSFGAGPFSLPLTGLPEDSWIYYRAKAKNAAGWGYGGVAPPEPGEEPPPGEAGDVESFHTAILPTVVTHPASEIAGTTAMGNGAITHSGFVYCTEWGFEWGIEPEVYPNSVTATGDFEVGLFSRFLTGLPDDTTIYYRAKAHNSAGWGYGSEEFFVTEKIVPPEVNTYDAVDIRAFTVIGRGEITHWGWETCTERGFEWGTSPGVYPNIVTDSGSFEEGGYSRIITGLPTDTTIYYRARARNSAGLGYGMERTFKTRLLILPSVMTYDATHVTEVEAMGQGFIIDDGGEDCVERGFEWGESSGVYPNDVTQTGAFRTGHYSLLLANLPSFVTIYYRAKARNSLGRVYGDEKTFVTQHYPAVTTGSALNITKNSAAGTGRIVDIGHYLCDERGFEWGTEPGVYPNSVTETGTFGVTPRREHYTLALTNLPSFVRIYYRAKARNLTGWGYGQEVSFITVYPPVVSTRRPTWIHGTVATGHGNISDVGHELASERGFEWGTEPGVYPNSVTETGSFGVNEWHQTYTLVLTGLPVNTVIYYRAKARNSAGWGYGNEVAFWSTRLPVVATIGPARTREERRWMTWIAATKARVWGRIVYTGSGRWVGGRLVDWEKCTVRGFEWGTEPGVYPNSVIEKGNFGSNRRFPFRYELLLTGLPPDTKIYFRAKAKNSVGWDYGDERTFSTAHAPAVVTHSATGIRATSFTGQGEITDTGSDWERCSERGFEWGFSPGAYVDSLTETGTFEKGPYSRLLTGLPSNTTIYYRARTRNTVGWAYGNERSFVTLELFLPTVKTGVVQETETVYVTDITGTTAVAHGTIVDDGNEYCDERGFDWGTSPGVYTNSVTETGVLAFGSGPYSLTLTGLPDGTTIFFRAKARNSLDWGYGEETSFTTPKIVIPTVSTGDATDIDGTRGLIHGAITHTGWETCTKRGFDWGFSPGVYPNSEIETGAFGTGAFMAWLTGLPYNTAVYYRAKARNSIGWGYGSEKTFNTAHVPTVTTQDATDVTRNSATGHGNITDVGRMTCDRRGFDWGLHSGLYIKRTLSLGTFDVGAYTRTLHDLPTGARIYYRAIARNPVGWSYGNELFFFTLGLEPPTVITKKAVDITTNSALAFGEVVDTGGEDCDKWGFEWGTTPGLYPNSVTETGIFKGGIFLKALTGLPDNTTIYFRAKARNPAANPTGWGYGSELSFTTLSAAAPLVGGLPAVRAAEMILV